MIEANQREMLTGTDFPVSRNDYPIILIHEDSPHDGGKEGSTPITNEMHDQIAIELIKHVAHWTREARIVIECYYAGYAKNESGYVNHSKVTGD